MPVPLRLKNGIALRMMPKRVFMRTPLANTRNPSFTARSQVRLQPWSCAAALRSCLPLKAQGGLPTIRSNCFSPVGVASTALPSPSRSTVRASMTSNVPPINGWNFRDCGGCGSGPAQAQPGTVLPSDANRVVCHVYAIHLPVERRGSAPRGRLTLRAKMNRAAALRPEDTEPHVKSSTDSRPDGRPSMTSSRTSETTDSRV